MTYLDAIFEVAYERNHRLIRNIVRKLLPLSDWDIVEDIVQSVFLKAWQHLLEFRGESDIRGWLCTIATNQVIDYLRQRKSQFSLSRQDYDEKGLFIDNGEINILENLHSWMNPDVYTFYGELQDLGLTAARSLPERYFTILEMSEQDGLDSNEIAQRLGLTPGNARIMLFRMKERIRVVLSLPGVS